MNALAFELPDALEAREPAEQRGLRRDEVRLLVATKSAGAISHHMFHELHDLLRAGDLLVVNVSATLPAAIAGRRPNGTAVRVHIATRAPRLGDSWRVVELRSPDGSRPASGRPRETIELDDGASLELVAPYASGARLMLARFSGPAALEHYLERHGEPIRYGYVRQRWPLEAYQNVYATIPGSAEMPSAGRPFSSELITRLISRGVLLAPITLHAGVSSPERHEGPFPEFFEVPEPTARVVNSVRDGGGRVIAVGTTVVRALETAVGPDGQAHARSGWTGVVITPERRPTLIDGLITGWHEPEASHLQMLEAIAGAPLLARSYEAALRHGYLWHEFGDSHLILPCTACISRPARPAVRVLGALCTPRPRKPGVSGTEVPGPEVQGPTDPGLGAQSPSPQVRLRHVIQQSDHLRGLARLEQHGASWPVGVRGCGAMDEQRLVQPGPGVDQDRSGVGAEPVARVIVREWSGPMNVPEHHPVGLDPEPVHHPAQRRNAGPQHLPAQQRRGQGRDPAVQQPAPDLGHRRRPDQLGQVVDHGERRAWQPAADASRRRTPRPFVVNRQRAVTRRSAQQAPGDPERRLWQQVTIQVVTVRGPHPIRQPHPRIVDSHGRPGEPRGQPRQQRRGIGRDDAVDREPGAFAAQPRADQRPVVITRHDHHFAVRPELFSYGPQQRLGDRHRVLGSSLQQFDHVTEQYQAVDPVHRLGQSPERFRSREHAMLQTGAQVQIGDDKRSHAPPR